MVISSAWYWHVLAMVISQEIDRKEIQVGIEEVKGSVIHTWDLKELCIGRVALEERLSLDGKLMRARPLLF